MEPKRAKVKAAQQSLDKKQKELKRAEKALQEVLSKVASLKLKYDESIAQKKALEDEAEMLQMKLQTARQSPPSPVCFFPISQYLLEPASGVWTLECGVLTPPLVREKHTGFMFNTAHCVSILPQAEKLIGGLAGERERWEATIAKLDVDLSALPGDCLAAAAFLSYCGPFPSEYRQLLVEGTWVPSLRKNSISCSEARAAQTRRGPLPPLRLC